MKLELSIIGINNVDEILDGYAHKVKIRKHSNYKQCFFQIGTADELSLDYVLDKSCDNDYFRITSKTIMSESEMSGIKYFSMYPKLYINQDHESFKITDSYIESNKNFDNFILDRAWLKSIKFKEDKIQSFDWAFEFFTGKQFFESFLKNISGIEQRSVFKLKTGQEFSDLILIFVKHRLENLIRDMSWLSNEGKLKDGTLVPADLITINYNKVDSSYSIFRTKDCFIKKNYGTIVVVDFEAKNMLLEHDSGITFEPVLNEKSELHIEYNCLWEKALAVLMKYRSRKKFYFG